MDHPTPKLLDAVIALFAETLGQEAGPDADFFDLGGDSLAAATLMLGLESVGVRLPVAALIDAPTPAGLVALVESGGAGEVLPVVTLKPGDPGTPVFLLPGAGGSVLEMVRFARLVETPHRLLGLQALDGRGGRLPVASVGTLVDLFLPLIGSVQPHGPYTIAGYSIGGVVAIEVARRLQARGESVRQVIMIDTMTPLAHFPPRLKLAYWWRRLVVHAGRARRMGSARASAYLLGRAGGLARDLGVDRPASGRPAGADRTAEARAFLEYRPRRFDGRVAFIQADDVEDWRGHYPDVLWRYFAREFQLRTVPGDHWSMVSKSPDVLAREFTAALS